MTIHPLILSTFDVNGGAAKAAFRLHEGLRGINIDSKMLVQYKDSDDPTVIGASNKLEKTLNQMRPTLDNLPLNFYDGHGYGAFSPQWFPDFITNKITTLSPDIINFHWTCGFIQIESIPRFKKPLVWTLHDMWSFTGGCQYSQDCQEYTKSCGKCPQLNSDKQNDISQWVWQRKSKAWRNLNFTIITPSIWLAKCVRASSLFCQTTIEVVPNGIDIQRYKPCNRKVVREWLNLPQDKQLVLIGANSLYFKRKGSEYLNVALESLRKSNRSDSIELVVFGTLANEHKLDVGIKSHYIGSLSDDISLAMLYASVDLFLAPYKEDNLPNTIMEALACGTPCVAFDVGGISEMIQHQINGYLAKPFNTDELVAGVIWVLEDNHRFLKLCDDARKKVECEYSQELQARRYSQVFTEVVQDYSQRRKSSI